MYLCIQRAPSIEMYEELFITARFINLFLAMVPSQNFKEPTEPLRKGKEHVTYLLTFLYTNY